MRAFRYFQGPGGRMYLWQGKAHSEQRRARYGSGAGKHILTALAVLVSLALVSPAVARTSAVTIGATPTALLVWIAKERGFFSDLGLDVTIQMFSSGRQATEKLIDGEVDIATSSDSVFAGRALRHGHLRVLAVISASETARLVARGDSGIHKAEDLSGKRVGVTLKTVGDFFLTRYLILNGVNVDAPVMVDLQPPEIAQGLVDGTIDAGLTWEPFISDAEKVLGDNYRRLPGQLEQFYYFLLMTTDRWSDQHTREMQLILQALLRAEALAAREPDTAKKLIQKKFGYSRQYIDHLWPLINLHVSLPQALLFNLELRAKWQIRKRAKTANHVPDFLEFILTAPLTDIRKSSVGIVK